MNLQVYNTLSRTKEAFVPVEEGKIGIYLCGPTVYAEAHIGHMVGPVIFDTIKRYLTYCGFEVTWVVNITDVDDKLIEHSQKKGISMSELAEQMTADYLQNLAALGVDQIDAMPKATENMNGIIQFIQKLIERDFAYDENGDVFFDVAKDPEYGKLTNRTLDALQGEGGEAADKKRSSADFALWKRAKPGEPSWDSPWGPGRPGWHIECSAMSHGLLGESFDIHGGGLDLIFPHHENEIAQSECCHAKPMARYWMHNGLLKREAAGKIGGRGERDDDAPMTLEEIQEATDKKESRSNKAQSLASMMDATGGEKLRFFLLRTHYRSTVLYSDEAVAEAATSLDAFYRFFERFERITGDSFYALPTIQRRADGEFTPGDSQLLSDVQRLRKAFLAKMDDDFNTGGAGSDLFELIRSLNKFCDAQQLDVSPQPEDLKQLRQAALVIRELTALFGLFRSPPAAAGADDALVAGLMELLIEVRGTARQKKDFEMADVIRDRLTELGVTLEDRKDGTGWRVE